MGAYHHKKQKFLYHLPGRLAGVFLCDYDELVDNKNRKNVFHLEALLEDIVNMNESEVCVNCLLIHLKKRLNSDTKVGGTEKHVSAPS